MIRKDHILHFIVNVLATALSVFLYRLSPILLVPMLGIGLSLGKEYGDSKNPSNYWDWSDILADLLGIVLTLVALINF